jgi:hypothetical protein
MMELIQQLVAETGVAEQQAEGGVGLLLSLVQDKLSAGDFAKVESAIPDAAGLIEQAPATESGGLGGLLGGAVAALGGSELGNLASLAGGFAKLDLDPGKIGQFIPILLSFLQSQGGEEIAGLVGKVLQGD